MPVFPPTFADAPLSPEVSGDFDALYRAHASTVARWAVRLGGSGIDAEDVVQDVFTVVARRLGEFRSEAKVSTWLFRITENTVRNRRRQMRWRRLFGLSAAPWEEGQTPASEASTPYDDLVRRRALREVERLLERLPERSRKVLVLAELEEMSAEDMADLLGTKPGTIRVWLHRARAEFLREQEREERRQAARHTQREAQLRGGTGKPPAGPGPAGPGKEGHA